MVVVVAVRVCGTEHINWLYSGGTGEMVFQWLEWSLELGCEGVKQ